MKVVVVVQSMSLFHQVNKVGARRGSTKTFRGGTTGARTGLNLPTVRVRWVECSEIRAVRQNYTGCGTQHTRAEPCSIAEREADRENAG